MKIWLLRIIGFIVGAGLALALEVGLLLLLNEFLDKGLIPRGPGWLVIPIIAGINAAKIAPELGLLSKFEKQGPVANFWKASPLTRFIVVVPIFWILGVGAYVLVFEPYGYRMHSSEYAHMFKIMLFPPAILIAGYFTYVKLILPSKNSNEKT